jgi:hypothetical protein
MQVIEYRLPWAASSNFRRRCGSRQTTLPTNGDGQPMRIRLLVQSCVSNVYLASLVYGRRNVLNPQASRF